MFTLQSASSNVIDSSATKAGSDVQDGIVGFHDEDPGTMLDLKLVDTYNEQRVNTNSEISRFLNRPVLIQTYSIPFGGFPDQTFNPWFLFMNHPSIKKKIDNYYLFRGKLKLKVVLNASPFYYGSYLLSYRPLANYFSPAFVENTAKRFIAYSQRPHIYVYPQNNQGGEMLLPFMWHRDWLDISEADDVNAMGTCVFSELSVLRNANAVGTGTINVQIYASLTDYELSGPSVKLALQSGKDEYGDGIISKPASAIARAAGYLENVPVIGKFATATKIGASAVSSIASLFGFTNPPDISHVETFTPQPFPRMATTDISTGIEKLTLDSKNELSIDSSVSGVDLQDELNISSIVTKESYLTKFLWTAPDTPDQLLFNIAITPSLFDTLNTSLVQRMIQGTPMWMVSRMFSYWRGDIEIRLKFIASQYHRGRVRISWDPNGNISTTPNSTTEVYNKIVDISRCSDITIRVPYMQDTAYCNTGLLTDPVFSTSPLVYTPFFENGILTVRVLNEQTSPIASADIEVLVFVKGSDNLEFANPRELDPDCRFSPFAAQSGQYNYDEEESEVTNISITPSIASPNINLIYQGETVKSLRQILRRFSLSRSIILPDIVNTNPWSLFRSTFSRRPLPPGYDTNGINGAIGLTSLLPARYTWSRYHPINWVSQCFIAERGSYNIRANYIGITDITAFKISRNQSDIYTLSRGGYSQSLTASGKQNTSRNLIVNTLNDPGGMSYTNTKTNTSLSVSLPFYSIYKFINTNNVTKILGTSQDLSNYDGAVIEAQVFPRYQLATNVNQNDLNRIDLYYAAGTDYNPIFFLNVPTIYRYISTPSSSETVP